jgi:acyl-CoA synthetase (AMP-forming)/AMP-acid ligase II
MAPHFFTATLGEAATLNTVRPHNIKTIPQLLDVLARDYPSFPAVGMGLPGGAGNEDEDWGAVVYCTQETLWTLCVNGWNWPLDPAYSELAEMTNSAAHHLARKTSVASGAIPQGDAKTEVVALFSDSSLDMLLCFFGLIRIGYAVLMIALEIHPQASQHTNMTAGRNAIPQQSNTSSRLRTANSCFTLKNWPPLRFFHAEI